MVIIRLRTMPLVGINYYCELLSLIALYFLMICARATLTLSVTFISCLMELTICA